VEVECVEELDAADLDDESEDQDSEKGEDGGE